MLVKPPASPTPLWASISAAIAALVSHMAAITVRTKRIVSYAPATTTNAANGVAQAKAKLASAHAIVNSVRQKSGANRGSTGASRSDLAPGRWRMSRDIGDLLSGL